MEAQHFEDEAPSAGEPYPESSLSCQRNICPSPMHKRRSIGVRKIFIGILICSIAIFQLFLQNTKPGYSLQPNKPEISPIDQDYYSFWSASTMIVLWYFNFHDPRIGLTNHFYLRVPLCIVATITPVYSFSWWKKIHPANPFISKKSPIHRHPRYDFSRLGNVFGDQKSFPSSLFSNIDTIQDVELGADAAHENDAKNCDNDNTNEPRNKEKDTETQDTSPQEKKLTTMFKFYHPGTNTTLYSHGVKLSQFKAWIRYKLDESASKIYKIENRKGSSFSSTEWSHFDEGDDNNDIVQYITSKQVDASDEGTRKILRKQWFQSRLLLDRTDVIAVYSSDSKKEEEDNDARSDDMKKVDGNQSSSKRGGFEDLLIGYVNRLVGIMEDEQLDGRFSSDPTKEEENIPRFDLLSWLKANYGHKATDKLLLENYEILTLNEQMKSMQHLLDWFKESFPYYYDKCTNCGASYREDCLKQVEEKQLNSDEDDDISTINDKDSNNSTESSKDEKDKTETHDGSFLGYCYPNPNELEGKASRTEIFECHKCKEITRFPRYNAVKQIVENSGRGRCGEFSILLYRIFRALGHECRWVVDWADHVWVETRIGSRWVHMDPCEAALDNPLLYQDWGKSQTFIIALFVPLSRENNFHLDMSNPEREFALVEDTTESYTTKFNETIARREESNEDEIDHIIDRARSLLFNKLQAFSAQNTNRINKHNEIN